MAHTIKISEGLEELIKRQLTAPSIYELSLMTEKQQEKRIKEWLKENNPQDNQTKK